LGKPVDPSTSGSARRKATKAQKSKSKEKSRALSVTQSLNLEPALLPNTIRTVWVRVHPAIFDDAHQVLHESARFAIDELRTTPRTTADLDVTMDDNDKPTRIDEFAVDITDLREQLNAFEVVGPLANQVIAGALKPTQKDFQRPEFKEVKSILFH
jgi:ribonuclease P/MRP protein subunit POP1